MANVKTLLDQRRTKSDGTFNVVFRITNNRKVCTINSGISIQQTFWNENKMQVDKSHPNSKLLNIKLSINYFKCKYVTASWTKLAKAKILKTTNKKSKERIEY